MVVDELVTRVTLDDNYTARAVRAASAATALGSAVDFASRSNVTNALTTNAVTVALVRMGASQAAAAATTTVLTTAATTLAVALGAVVAGVAITVTAVAALSVGILAVGASMMTAAANFDALIMSLEAVEGSAERAKIRMAELREIAKAPGIGFQEAIRGFVQLRRSDMDPEFAKRVLMALANQIALSGGGQEEFARVARATMQIAVAPFLQGDELRQFSEAGVPAYGIVKHAFGTADTEQLKKMGISSAEVLAALVAEMEKMPKVASSAKNTIENLGIAFELLKVSGGTLIAETVVPWMEAMSETLDKFEKAGIGKSVIEAFGQAFSGFASVLKDTEGFAVSAAAALMTLGNVLQTFLTTLIKIKNLTGLGGTTAEMYKANEAYIRAQLGLAKALADEAALNAPPDIDVTQTRVEQATGVTYLREIAKNTREALDIQKAVLGGGGIGTGINAVELAALRRGGGRGSSSDPWQELLGALRNTMLSIYIDASASSGRDRRRLGTT